MGLSFKFLNSIHDVNERVWNALWQSDYPFTQHAFLAALEDSQSVSIESGWQPHHLIVEDGSETACVMLLYLKTHSYGEYVFDWGWADAYHQNGLEYYPKLINAVPFTPATGQRIAFSEHVDKQTLLASLFSTLEKHCQQQGISGFHSLFPSSSCTERMKAWPNTAHRLGCQFHWFNAHYTNFDHFLAQMTSRKRKTILRERRKVKEANIVVSMSKGHDLKTEDWQAFYQLYQRTYLKRSGHSGYLSEGFFTMLGQDLPHQTAMARAYSNGHCVAAALYFYDSETLYGRYWGAIEEFDGVHFECCYYQGIEFAISEGLQRFDPGAQGEHKIQRGFTPVLTQSIHWLAHTGFQRAIERFTQEEQAHIKQYCLSARDQLPFKEGMILVQPDILLEQKGKGPTEP